MAERELKTRMGWVTCPKDKCVELFDLHCKPGLKAQCTYFVSGVGNGTMICKYEEEDKEEE